MSGYWPTRWRFLPLRDSPRFGVLVVPGGKPAPAQFLSPKEAKEETERKRGTPWRVGA